MKLVVTTITLLFSGAIAFAPSTPDICGRSIAPSAAVLFAGPEDEEGGGLDLDLEEMFDMFDAADKGKDFEKVIKDVKKDKEE